jgi:hypothetical protein
MNVAVEPRLVVGDDSRMRTERSEIREMSLEVGTSSAEASPSPDTYRRVSMALTTASYVTPWKMVHVDRS